jgi:hypothetical protein
MLYKQILHIKEQTFEIDDLMTLSIVYIFIQSPYQWNILQMHILE